MDYSFRIKTLAHEYKILIFLLELFVVVKRNTRNQALKDINCTQNQCTFFNLSINVSDK